MDQKEYRYCEFSTGIDKFVGRSLQNTAGAVPEEIKARLKLLWDSRLLAARLNPQLAAVELREYGWWFASAKFEDAWSVAQLQEALRYAKRVVPDHLVVERLIRVASEMPAETMLALKAMIEGDDLDNQAILGWSDKAKSIIRTALGSGDPKAKQFAEDAVNFLAARRYFDFIRILKEPAL